MRYLKLTGVEFKDPTQAANAAKLVLPYGPSVDCYYRRIPGGKSWEKEVVWTLRVPATASAAGLQKRLEHSYPCSKWTLFEIDADGFEINLQPTKESEAAEREAPLIPVRA